nr:hypothetical protein [Nitrosomonas ureae]
MTATEIQIEQDLITKLGELKYTYRPDIRDREALEKNFRERFEELNRVELTNSEFSRLRDEIVNADVFAATRHLREKNSFERDDGTPLSRPSLPTTTTALAPTTASTSSTSTTRMCKSASRISNTPTRICPTRRRSISSSWWTCCSPVSIPNT